MNIKKVSLTVTAFLIPVLCSAQQTPLITVHNDDKPPYISPFDKPSHTAALESAAQSFSAVKSPLPNKESNTVSGNMSAIAPQENTGKKPEPDVKKTEPVKKQARYGSRSRQKYRNSHIDHTGNSEAVTDASKLPSVPVSSAAVAAKSNLVTMPVTPTPTVESTSIPPNITTRAPVMLSSLAGKDVPPPTIPINSGETHKTLSAMPTDPVVMKQHEKPTAVIEHKVPTVNNNIPTENAKANVFSNMSKVVAGFIVMLLATLAYGLKRTIFRKDPALTDPWFKPAK